LIEEVASAGSWAVCGWASSQGAGWSCW
jgi:hypothetical protein